MKRIPNPTTLVIFENDQFTGDPIGYGNINDMTTKIAALEAWKETADPKITKASQDADNAVQIANTASATATEAKTTADEAKTTADQAALDIAGINLTLVNYGKRLAALEAVVGNGDTLKEMQEEIWRLSHAKGDVWLDRR